MCAHRLLVIGCGSIGERHIRTFLQTGRCAKVVGCDRMEEARKRVEQRYGIPTFADWSEACTVVSPSVGVVATPAPSHAPIAVALFKLGIPCLVEKPLTLDESTADEVCDAQAHEGIAAATAYVYHFIPAIHEARAFVLRGTVGRILHATAVSGQDFAALRPAFRSTYYRTRETGGGAIQDSLTHVVNVIDWLLGPAKRVYCDASQQLLDGVTVEDTVNICARHEDALVSYALNQIQSPNQIEIMLHGEKGSVAIQVHRQRWGHMLRGEENWTWHEAPVEERDCLFVAQANAFLDLCEGKTPTTVPATLEDGRRAVQFNRAALRSLAEGQPIDLV